MSEAFTRTTKEHARHLCEAALDGVQDRRDADWIYAMSSLRKRLNRRWLKRWRKHWSKEDMVVHIKLNGRNPDLRYWRTEDAAQRILKLIEFTDTDDIYITASEMKDLAS